MSPGAVRSQAGVRRGPPGGHPGPVEPLVLGAGSALAGAIVLGFVAMVMGNHLGRLWIWASIAILVAVIVLMTPVAGRPMLRVRRALGLRSDRQGPGVDPTLLPLSDDELVAARAALRPGMAAMVGLVGTLLLVWLMEAKPF